MPEWLFHLIGVLAAWIGTLFTFVIFIQIGSDRQPSPWFLFGSLGGSALFSFVVLSSHRESV